MGGSLRRVFKWIGLGILVLVLLGSLLLNLALMAVVLGKEAAGAYTPRFREITVAGEGPNKVALIPINGVIGGRCGGTLWPGRGTLPSLLGQFRAAARDKDVKAVLLEIDSPGGSVGDSDLLHHEVSSLRKAGKPVVSYFRDVAASGAYYIAAASDRIVAQPTTITGSIGVMLHSVNVEGLFEKIGLKDVTIKKGTMKDMLSPTRALTPEEKQVLQEITDDVYDRFVHIVATGRQMEEEDVLRIADGRIFLAEDALEMGLVDAIGYRDEAVASVSELLGEQKVRLIRYEKVFSLRDIVGASSWIVPPSLGVWEGLREARSPRLMYLWTIN